MGLFIRRPPSVVNYVKIKRALREQTQGRAAPFTPASGYNRTDRAGLHDNIPADLVPFTAKEACNKSARQVSCN